MPSVSPIPLRLTAIAAKYKVTVRRDPEPSHRNHGGCAGTDIFVGEFDDPDIELVAFFHELGHALWPTISKRGCTLCTLSHEGLAWELGLALAFQCGYQWDHYSKEMKWAREQLKTYCKDSSCN